MHQDGSDEEDDDDYDDDEDDVGQSASESEYRQ